MQPGLQLSSFGSLSGQGQRGGRKSSQGVNRLKMLLVESQSRTQPGVRTSCQMQPETISPFHAESPLPRLKTPAEGLGARPRSQQGGGVRKAVSITHLLQLKEAQAGAEYRSRPGSRPPFPMRTCTLGAPRLTGTNPGLH